MSSQWKCRLSCLVAIALAVGCTTTTTPPPSAAPSAPVNGLVDPRSGSTESIPQSFLKHFDAGWRALGSGDIDLADSEFASILRKHPEYTPAILGRAAVNIQREQYDEASAKLNEVLSAQPDNFAALYYRAEIESRSGETAAALQHFQALTPPDQERAEVQERIAALRTKLFDELYAQASRETNAAASAETLRKALAVQPEANAARLLLVQKLIEIGRFDDARRQVEPLLHDTGTANQPDVQEAMAKIDIGKARYQEAINRYEQLARAYPGRYDQPLADVKQRWVEMNLPLQYQSALSSTAITRTDLAVLVYWDLPSVRFAANLPEPPIAVDIPTSSGREEFVRALSLGLFPVDPVTRRAYPDRVVGSPSFLRTASRLLALRGSPACAGGASGDSEAARAVSILLSCGIPASGLSPSAEAPVTGRQAHEVLDGIRRKTGSSE